MHHGPRLLSFATTTICLSFQFTLWACKPLALDELESFYTCSNTGEHFVLEPCRVILSSTPRRLYVIHVPLLLVL